MSKIANRFNVTECKTAEQLLLKCGLMWEPELRKAGYSDPSVTDARTTGCDAFRAVVNPSTGLALAFAGTRFRPNSHIKVVNDTWGLVDAGHATPQNVSVWDGGARIAIQLRCHDLDVQVGPKSVISPLLTLVVNHDAEGSDRGFFADFDYWCKNQAGMVAKIQGEGVRHSATVLSRYQDLLEDRIRSLRTNVGDRYQAMKRMADGPRRLTGRDLLVYFGRAMNIAPEIVAEQSRAALQGEVLSADGKVLKALVGDWKADDHGVPGTVWHAYSAVTRYTTHTEGRNEATRLQRAMLGAQDRYSRAFTEAARVAA